jgi:predicted Zn-dependent protease
VIQQQTLRRLVVSTLIVSLAACGVSTQQEVQMGQQASQEVSSQLPILNDAVVTGYVNSLGQQIASKTSRSDLEWHFAVVNSDVVNAFALPGGYVYVNRGILENASRMDELAGVMGHEIEHVVRRHSVKQMEQMQGANVGVTLACVLTRVCESQAAQAAINVGGTLVFAKFSRADEVQADEGGFRNVVNAGVSPQGMLSFFEKLLQLEQQSGGSSNAAAWFSDHPGTQDRIADIQQMLGQLSQTQLSRLTQDTREFQAMKQRLRSLPPAPRVSAQAR